MVNKKFKNVFSSVYEMIACVDYCLPVIRWWFVHFLVLCSLEHSFLIFLLYICFIIIYASAYFCIICKLRYFLIKSHCLFH